MRVHSLTRLALFVALFVALFTAMQLHGSMASVQQLIDLNEFNDQNLIENDWLELPGGFDSLEPGDIQFATFPPGTFQSSTDNQGIAITVESGQVAFLYAANPIQSNGQPILMRKTLRASSPWASVAFIAFSGDLSTGADVDGSMGMQFPASSEDFVESEKRMVLVYEPNRADVMTPAIQVAGTGDESCTVWIDRLEVLSLDAEAFGSDPGVPSVVDPTPTMTPLPPEPTPTPTPEPAPIDPHIPLLAREVGHFEYGVLNSMAYSPDAQSILTGGSDGFARLWDIETGLVTRTFDRHRAAVRSVAFSPDASLVLTGGADGLAKLWNAASGELIHSLEGHHSIIYSVGFSSDGARIVTASGDRTVKLWDAASGDLIRTYEGHEGAVRSAAFSPDGTQLLTGGLDRTARLWDVASGDPIRVFEGHTNIIHAVGFSPDGTQIVTGSADHTAKVWDIGSGEEILAFTGHENQVFSAAFSPDGTSVVTGSVDRTAKLWDAATGEELASFNAIIMGSPEPRYEAVLSPDGFRVLAGGSRSNTPALWDIATGELVRAFYGHTRIVSSVALSLDGNLVLTASFNHDNSARLWDAASGELIRLFVGHSSTVAVAAFSQDGTRIVTGSSDQTAKLWNASSGELIHTFQGDGHSDIVGAAAISPNGEYVLTGSDDQTAKLWNANSGELIHALEGHTARIYVVAFSPDGSQFLTASDDRSAKLWNAASGELIHTLSGHSHTVTSVGFSRDGDRILTASEDHTAILWNTETGEQIRSFTGHTSGIFAAEFSPDEAHILTGGRDRTARIWDVVTGELLRTYLLREFVDGYGSMVVSRDGTQILTGSIGSAGGGTVKLWDITSVEVPAPLPQDPEIVPLADDDVRISLNLATGDTPLDMAYIPAGEFLMGSPEEDVSSYPFEHPQHRVTISRSYYMGKHPVTQAQYKAVMGENPSSYLGSNLPVEMVSWEDAVRFCNRLSELLGLELVYNEETWEADWSANGVRLPTEAEWEYAIRAGTTTRFYWGDDPEYAEIDLYAWRFGNHQNGENMVGQKLPNAWGLFDMSGNVWEWCYDWMGDYSEDEQVDPIGPETGIYRVCRGGSFMYTPLDCRSAQRRPEDPSTGRRDRGFRIVLPYSP